jgi:predicted DNA-binding mobile mystery protein A
MWWENPYKTALQKLDQELKFFRAAGRPVVPERGWIYTIRMTLGMSQRQLAKRLRVSTQEIHHTEKREAAGGVTLRRMREVAQALDMEFVYGFTPKAPTLTFMVGMQAARAAEKKLPDASDHVQRAEAEKFKRKPRRGLWEDIT